MESNFSELFRDDLARLIRLRRDVRQFKSEPLPEGLLEILLKSANQAPSVGLSQPWRFVLVESEDKRQLVRNEFERANQLAAEAYPDEQAALYRSLKLAGLKEAPVHLLLLADLNPNQGKGLGRQTQPETVRDSTICAVQNLWLMARAHGVGMGWVSILDETKLLEVLMPDTDLTWIGYFCLGFPVEARTSPELERLGWEKRRPLEDLLFRI